MKINANKIIEAIILISFVLASIVAYRGLSGEYSQKSPIHKQSVKANLSQVTVIN